MKKSQFTPEQITFALRQAESGTPVPEVCRKMGISDQTFYRWKKRYLGMGIAELRRLKILEEENRKLKQLVADLSLDKQMLQDVLRKKDYSLLSSGNTASCCRSAIGLASVGFAKYFSVPGLHIGAKVFVMSRQP